MTASFPVTIYHNPRCATSRNTLAMIRAAGYAPQVIDYLSAGWEMATLSALIHAAGLTPRTALRVKGTLAGELGLTRPDVSDQKILEEMVVHPALVERPFVVTPRGVRLCRPSETVFTLLDRLPQSFVKENGELVKP